MEARPGIGLVSGHLDPIGPRWSRQQDGKSRGVEVEESEVKLLVLVKRSGEELGVNFLSSRISLPLHH